MSGSWEWASAVFAAVLLSGPVAPSPSPPTPSGSPPPPSAGCPSIGGSDRSTITGPTMYRLGAGVLASIQVADDGHGDAGDAVMHFEVYVDPAGDQPPVAQPATPVLKWSIDGGPWHATAPVYGSVNDRPTWISSDEPAPAIRPMGYRTLRIWLALHAPAAAGDYVVGTMFSSPACGAIGTGRTVSFTYDPQGLGHPHRVTRPKPSTPAPTDRPAGPTPSPSAPVTSRPPPSVSPPPASAPRAAAGSSRVGYRAIGTAVAVVLALAGLVEWRRARRGR